MVSGLRPRINLFSPLFELPSALKLSLDSMRENRRGQRYHKLALKVTLPNQTEMGSGLLLAHFRLPSAALELKDEPWADLPPVLYLPPSKMLSNGSGIHSQRASFVARNSRTCVSTLILASTVALLCICASRKSWRACSLSPSNRSILPRQ